MSKASQQQSTTPRDRAPSAFPTPKQQGKGDANGAGAKPSSPKEPSKPDAADAALEFAVIPAESAEEDFFARGEVNSLPPAAFDVLAPELDDDAPERIPLTPAQLARRARLRRIVGSVVGAAAVLTAVVGAKALSAPPAKVAASEGSLNVPHQVVPSIAMAAPEEPAAAKTAPETLNAPDPGTPPADTVAAAENSGAPGATAEPSDPKAGPENGANQAPTPAATVRRLPVIDVDVPFSPDPATDKQWESAAQNLASQDFKGADSAFAELGKRGDTATREAARLARALWWTANGRHNEVKPVIADLAANATTPSIRQQAKDRLRTN
jgi:hypothetical protein